MQQATDYPGPVAVTVTVLVTVLVIMTVLVLVLVLVAVLVTVVWAAPAVHIIQHARENALPHINTYQGRALAN
jgi:Flp pilus assembly protein CpaB